MSMSIPIFFRPVTYVNPQDSSDEHLIVDGGVLSNFSDLAVRQSAGSSSAMADVRPAARRSLTSITRCWLDQGPPDRRRASSSILGFLLAIGRHHDGGP